MGPLVIPTVLLLYALRVSMRGSRQRTVRIETMWIAPLIYCVLIGVGIYAAPPPLTLLPLSVLAVGLMSGLGLGWLRGRGTAITIDTETHTLKREATAWGLVMLAALYLVREASGSYLSVHAADWNLPPVAVADAALLLALGSIVGRRIEIFIRCRRLLADARAAKAAGQEMPTEVSQDHA